MQGKGLYHLDINSTTSCNLRCTYCFEHEHFDKKQVPTDDLIKNIKEKVDFLLSSKEFLDKFDGVNINFWGGEPTLNFEFMKDMTSYYEYTDNVQFLIYSNGFHYTQEFLDFLKYFKNRKIYNNEPKIILQISYDGLASHDVSRVDIRGKGSALKVKENMYKVIEMGIPFLTQQVIAFQNFDKLYLNYKEIKEINKHIQRVNGNTRWNIAYSPVIDYISNHNFSEEQLKNYKIILKEQLILMAKEELEHYKNYRQFFFSWLNPNKAICGAGSGLTAITLSGDVTVCHGSIYMEDDTHKIANIYDSCEKFLKELLDKSFKYSNVRFNLPVECKSCHAHYCMKCNVKKFEVSSKEDYFDKWTDFNNQRHLCEIYKFLGTFRMSLMKLLEK